MNQREIKFRAWNMSMFRMEHFNLGDTVPYYYKDENGPSTPYDVMQSTGLKDKNGKEIYEGDIVKCLHPKVLYQTNPEYDEVLHEIKWSTKEGRWTDGHSNFGSGGEIIGNIYEHPKLLNI